MRARVTATVLVAISAASMVLASPVRAASPPGPPTNVSLAQTTFTTATVTWGPPASDGGSPITTYVATASPTIPSNPTRTCTTTGATTCTITGLTFGQFYAISVAAGNPGLGQPSVVVMDVPIGNGLPTVQKGAWISTITPFYGRQKGGTRLTIQGGKLNGTTKVTFNGVEGAHLVVVSSTELKVTTPKGAVGPATVVAKTPQGKATSMAYSFVQ